MLCAAVTLLLTGLAGGCGKSSHDPERCTAGTARCLDRARGEVCDDVGNWLPFECEAGVACVEGACGEACTPGDLMCLSESAAQLCRADGTWAPFACGSDETCEAGVCQREGGCPGGTRECVTDMLIRICLDDGSEWLTAECANQTPCRDGECRGGCAPGDLTCLTTRIPAECTTAGDTWFIYDACAENERCSAGRCQLDLHAACTPGEVTCLDAQTPLVCADDGSGYERESCPSGTVCDAAAHGCAGDVCTIGETTCVAGDTTTADAVRRCVDGESWQLESCRLGEICVSDSLDRARCVADVCTPGERVCGDPSDPEVSDADTVSVCTATNDGSPRWVHERCDPPSTCSEAHGDATCVTSCIPGDTRCVDTMLAECGPDGEWSAGTPCPGTRLCFRVPIGGASLCGDAECEALGNVVSAYRERGYCAGDAIQRCGEDGRLGSAVSCETGVCIPSTYALYGQCGDPSACDEGEQQCADYAPEAYRECIGGLWVYDTCPTSTCVADGDRIACGTCVPDSTRCEGELVRTCGADNEWGPAERCAAGACADGRCVAECLAGQVRCAGETVVAPDGSTAAFAAEQVCSTLGAFAAATPCPEGTACRASSTGKVLGCVACVGTETLGGNEEGVADTRCTSDGGAVETCENGAWAAHSTCDSNETCVKLEDVPYECTRRAEAACGGLPVVPCEHVDVSTYQVETDCCLGACSGYRCTYHVGDFDPTCETAEPCGPVATCCAGHCVSDTCSLIKAEACWGDPPQTCIVADRIVDNGCCEGACTTTSCTEHPEDAECAVRACGAATDCCEGACETSSWSSGPHVAACR